MFGRSRRRFAVVAALSIATTGALATIGAGTAGATQYDVTNGDDAGPGSLRQAFIDAGTNAGPDTIVVLDAINTITLTSTITQIDNSGNVSVDGNGAVVDLNDTGGVISWTGNGANTLTLTDLTLQDGNGVGGRGITVGNANLALDTVEIKNNHPTDGTAGGAGATGTLTITNSNIHDNSSNGTGGFVTALAGGAASGGAMTITGSTIKDNSAGATTPAATDNTGGVRSNSTLNITNSTIEGNQSTSTGSALAAGGIAATGAVAVTSSTITANTASSANAVATGGGGSSLNALTITNSTVSNNNGASTGSFPQVGLALGGQTGIDLKYVTIKANTVDDAAVGTGGTLSRFGSVFIGTVGGVNCFAGSASASGGYNYADDTANTCALTGTGDSANNSNNAMLAALADNGGATKTMLPDPGSPLVNRIPNGSCAVGITTDQRGTARPEPPGGSCDTGAVELVQAATFTVVNGNTSGTGSLRQAFVDAAAHAGDDTIVVQDSINAINIGTSINQIDNTGNVGVDGNGAVVTQIGTSGVIIWDGTASATLSLSDIKITGGNGVGGFGVGTVDSNLSLTTVEVFGNHPTSFAGAGGVGSSGTLTIADSNIHDNSVNGPGIGAGQIVGGAASIGNMTVTNSTIKGNTAGVTTPAANQNIGGVYAIGTLTVTSSTIEGNSGTGTGASVNGGGAGANGQVTVDRSTINGNSASSAGGFAIGGVGSSVNDVLVTNSTITANTATATSDNSEIGGVAAVSAVTLIYATVVGNTTGGTTIGSQGDLTLFGSVMFTPGSGVNCVSANTVSSGYNYADDTTCNLGAPGDSGVGTNNAMLDALGDNGGPTKTMKPQMGSPLINRVSPSGCDTAPNIDQRGTARPQESACETGSVELLPVPQTYTVTDAGDVGSDASDCTTPVANSCSLRDAFAAAAGHVGADSIIVQDSINLITLTTAINQLDNSGVDVDGNGAVVEQTGVNQGVIGWDGPPAGTLSLSDMTVKGGDGDGGIGVGVAEGKLTLTNVEVTDNHPNDNAGAGGVGSLGDLTIINSNIHDNSINGPGIGTDTIVGAAGSFGNITITNSMITNNTAGLTTPAANGNTGGVLAIGTVQVTGSTIKNNSGTSAGTAGAAGGIHSSGTMTVTASTIEGNSATAATTAGANGGIVGFAGVTVVGSTFNLNTASAVNGIAVAGANAGNSALTLTNSTLTQNTAASSTGFEVGGGGAGMSITLLHATAVDNTAAGGATFGTFGTITSTRSVIADTLGAGAVNCFGFNAVTSGGFNFSDDANTTTSCKLDQTGDVLGPNPMLGALANNGGPTKTRLPTAGSPLINTIPLASCSTDVGGVDQRGVTRPQPTGGSCDKGAVEVRVPGAPTIGTASAGVVSATVRWTAPASNGDAPRTGYTATAIAPNGTKFCTAVATATSCVVSNLTPGVSHRFTVTAANAVGSDPASGQSNAVVPIAKIVKPDVMGGKSPLCTTTGSNKYYPTSQTVATVSAKRGKTVVFCMRFQNDGNHAYSNKVKGTGSTANRFTVKYGTGSTAATQGNMTSHFLSAAGHPTGTLQPTKFGQTIYLRVKVESGAPTSGAAATKTITVTMTSNTSPAKSDKITFKVKAIP